MAGAEKIRARFICRRAVVEAAGLRPGRDGRRRPSPRDSFSSPGSRFLFKFLMMSNAIPAVQNLDIFSISNLKMKL
jgi:hypothetical protein